MTSLKKIKSTTLFESVNLDVGEVENVAFTLEETLPNKVNKYKVKGTLKPKETNAYLADYKAEIQKRGIVFPGN